jgi:hypothetical protein
MSPAGPHPRRKGQASPYAEPRTSDKRRSLSKSRTAASPLAGAKSGRSTQMARTRSLAVTGSNTERAKRGAHSLVASGALPRTPRDIGTRKLLAWCQAKGLCPSGWRANLSNQLGVGFFYTLAEIFRGVAAKIYIYQCVLAMAQ